MTGSGRSGEQWQKQVPLLALQKSLLLRVGSRKQPTELLSQAKASTCKSTVYHAAGHTLCQPGFLRLPLSLYS